MGRRGHAGPEVRRYRSDTSPIVPMRLAVLLSLLVGACTGPAPTSGPADDAELELRWSTGSLPPAYHHAETTRIEPDGGTLAVTLSYGQGPDTTFTFSLDEAERTALWADLDALGLWSRRWSEDRDPPVGGSSWSLDARDGARSAEVPPFVAQRQSDAKQALRDRIDAAVPLAVQAAADAWRVDAQSRLSE